MTQTTLNEYQSELSRLQREQQENVKEYNLQKTKASKRKVMNDKIIPLEIELESVRKGR